jgi:TPR repeat protein
LPDDKDKTVPGYRDPDNYITYSAGLITTAKGRFYAGELYYQGKSVPKNIARAADWFNKAANLGSSEAMNRIGELWAAGMDGPPNPKQALGWYRKAADKGLAEGELNLGRALEKGEGTAQNPVDAWAWLKLASDQNLPAARDGASQLAAKLTADERAAANARMLELAARLNPQPSK